MDHALRIADLSLPLLYLLAAVVYGLLFFQVGRGAERLARPLLRVTVALHLGYLVLLTVRWHQLPAASVSQLLSALAFAVAAVYLIAEWRGRSLATGLFLVGMACVCQVLATVLQTGAPVDREIFHDPLFAIHAGTGLLGYAGFVVAACYGFLFLRVYLELKHGRFSHFVGKLPPLEVLERMMLGALLAGFAALTVAAVSGAVWAQRLFHGDWLHDPKILVTFATWGFYGLVLLLRRLHRWHSRQTAIASVAGLLAVIFSLLAVNLFLTQMHGFR